MKYYAGIGSRQTPEDVLEVMANIASVLAVNGYVLRSGGADGADMAFEKGCDLEKGKKEIYLPWKGFNRNPSELYNISPEAFQMAKKFHPNWIMLRRSAEKLHARNSYQIMGGDLKTPSQFVVCWSSGKGGTEQALRIARAYSIPIVNLFDPEVYTNSTQIIGEFIHGKGS